MMPTQNLFNEDELLLQIAQGDEQAFARLFKRYHQQLGAHIYRVTGSMEMAEEVVHDVFLKLWNNRTALQGIRCIKAYLFVISKNHALNCLKKTIREQQHQLKWEAEAGSEEQLVMQEADDNHYYSLLDHAINHLPPQQQKAYLLSRHERLKYHEIADEMNISRETVKKYLQLAVSSISTYLERNSDIVVSLLIFLSIIRP